MQQVKEDRRSQTPLPAATRRESRVWWDQKETYRQFAKTQHQPYEAGVCVSRNSCAALGGTNITAWIKDHDADDILQPDQTALVSPAPCLFLALLAAFFPGIRL